MRVDVFPRQAHAAPGESQVVSITITNTTTIIGGYTIRVLGADPGWVQLETEQLSLFPDESRTVTATVTPPAGIAAGSRRIAIQVRELTPPEDISLTDLEFTVPAVRAVAVRVDPVTVTAGRTASFSVIAENSGNTPVQGRLAGSDPANQVQFSFAPDYISLAPGEHAVVDMRARAKRHITGSPVVRMLGIYLDEPSDSFFTPETEPRRAREENDALATATFLQRAALSRGALTLGGLLVAISVFAIVITIALSRLVGQSTADRDLALQVAEAHNSSSSVGTSAVAGTVRLLTSGQPVPGVSVSVFATSDTSTPVATSATDDKGSYRVGQLPAGKYKISFRGAGFVQIWYPRAVTDADATTITLGPGEQRQGLDATLGGVPATISGTVVGDDVSAATLYLEATPGAGSGLATDTTGVQQLPADPSGTAPLPDDGNAIVQHVPVGADGSFTLSNVPSPSVYELVVTKAGYATSTQRIDVGAGENRTGVTLHLRQGDGLVAGTVSSATGPLPGVTITATSGQSTANTVSLSEGNVGAFTLRSLPTPSTLTVVASKPGYTAQTLTLSLSQGQKLTGVAITLGQSSGSIDGVVTDAATGRGAAGVAVTATNGSLIVQTETDSIDDRSGGQAGAFHIGGLPVPGTYTLSFSRGDLAGQTVSASLDASGHLAPQGSRVSNGKLLVVMQSATGTVTGTISQPGGARLCAGSAKLAEATVSLNSGARSYNVTSASLPRAECGTYRIDQVQPGTYTLTVSAGSGTTPTSHVVTVAAGTVNREDVRLPQPASLTGTVRVTTDGKTSTPAGWSVFLYLASDYPGQVSATTKTAKGGAFTFAGLDAGTYIVAVGPTSDPANSLATAQVTVRPSKHPHVVVQVTQ